MKPRRLGNLVWFKDGVWDTETSSDAFSWWSCSRGHLSVICSHLLFVVCCWWSPVFSSLGPVMLFVYVWQAGNDTRHMQTTKHILPLSSQQCPDAFAVLARGSPRSAQANICLFRDKSASYGWFQASVRPQYYHYRNNVAAVVKI